MNSAAPAAAGGGGKGDLRLLTLDPRDQSQHGRSQANRQGVARQCQKIAHAMHAEARQRFRHGVFGVEQVDGKRRQKGRLGAGG